MAIMEPGVSMQGMNVPQSTRENQGIGNGAPGTPLNREDNFAKAFGGGIGPDSAEPGVPPVPPQSADEATSGESSGGNLTGATGLAERLGVSQPMGGPEVLGVSNGSNASVSEASPGQLVTQAPVSPEGAQPDIKTTSNVADVLLQEAKEGSPLSANGISDASPVEAVAPQPVDSGITSGLGSAMNEPQIPATSNPAMDTTEPQVSPEDMRATLKDIDEYLKNAQKSLDKLLGNSLPGASDSAREPAGTIS